MKRKSLARIDLSDPSKPKLDFNSLKSFQNDIKDFKHDQRVWVTLETYYKTRTSAQNSLFHVYCQEIADETGQDLDTVKATVKAMYAQKPLLDKDGEPIVNKATGDVAMYIQDTRDMNTVEMATLTEHVRMFALEFFGIVLTLPEEQMQLKYK